MSRCDLNSQAPHAVRSKAKAGLAGGSVGRRRLACMRISPAPHTPVPPPVPVGDHVRRCAPISRRRRPSRAAPRSWARFTSLATCVLPAGDQGDAQACAVPWPPLHPTLHLAGLAPTMSCIPSSPVGRPVLIYRMDSAPRCNQRR
jgi:hypothetical protein